jgi:lipopolysaccharide export system protein LptA
MGMKRFAIPVAAAMTVSLMAGGSPAIGQEATSALRGHNTNAPVDVAADVQVSQGNLTLNAPRLTVAYSDRGGIQIQRLDASGGVTVRSPSETARGQYAIYDTGNRLITLLGGVVLTRGESQVRGGRLVLDLDSGRAVMDGGGRAAGAPAGTTTTTGGRVTGTFTVPQKRD